MKNYIIDDQGNVQVEPDLVAWGRWWRSADRIVGRDTVGETGISTVFLGTDHNLSDTGAPILWETMVFGGPSDHFIRRYTSREEAIAGHQQTLTAIRNGEVLE